MNRPYGQGSSAEAPCIEKCVPLGDGLASTFELASLVARGQGKVPPLAGQDRRVAKVP
jgi:hypothetical protein